MPGRRRRELCDLTEIRLNLSASCGIVKAVHKERNRMMNRRFFDAVEENPIIAAVKSPEDLRECCSISEIRVIFILYGDICSLKEIVDEVRNAGKIAMVHVDLISGLSAREVAVDFIHENVRADGIITTRPALIKRAKELSMFTVLRFFLLDSMAYENICQQQFGVKPDFIEVLPGVMPDIIRRLCRTVKTEIIAGGLISDRESVMAALNAGACAVSSTNHTVWRL